MNTFPPRVALSADGKKFTLRTGLWRGTFDIDRLDAWIETYQRLRDRDSKLYGRGAYRQNYEPVVNALEQLRARVRTVRPARAPDLPMKDQR